MSTPEAVSDIAAQTPPPRLLTMRERALIYGFASLIAGAAALVTAVWDWSSDAAIPDTVPGVLGMITVAALLLHERHDRIAERHQLATEIEQVTAKLTDFGERVEVAFETGRRYQEATNGQGRPRVVN